MWHVIQVATGKEEEVKEVIHKRIGCGLYKCFCLKRERVWRRGGKCIVHVEPLFPGYVFVSTDMPAELFKKLKEIPQFTKLLKAPDNAFLRVEPEEQAFLMDLTEGEDTVRLSEIGLDADKNIVAVKGPLHKFEDRIVRKKTRLRYVVVRVRLLGEDREVLLGVKVNGMDC